MHRLDPVMQQEGKQDAARQLLSLLGVGAAGGFGVRGLMGLRDMLQQRQVPVGTSSNLPQMISIFGQPRHPQIENERKALPASPLQKLSAAAPPVAPPAAAPAAPATGGFDLAKTIGPHLPNTHTLNPILNEWGIPAGMLALGGGAVGGYKLMDWLLNKEHEMAGTNDVDEAKDDYHKALAEQYRAAMLAKRAGDDFGINELADRYAEYVAAHGHGNVKQAFTMSALGHMFPALDKVYESIPGMGYDNWQALKGGVNAAALGAMLGTGKLTYDWAKGQNKHELLQKALKKRQMLRQQMSPPPIVALTEEDQPSNAA